MLLTILLSIVSLAPAPVIAPPNAVLRPPLRDDAPNVGPCLNANVKEAAERPRTRPRNLVELPPGGLYLTVVRRIGNCQIPTLVKHGFGAVDGGSDRR